MPKGYTLERKSDECIVVRCGDHWGPESEQWFLWTSDVHWDHPNCDRKLYKHLLDQAIERDAGIFDNGDFFCCMQGRNDRRSSKNKIRPEHQTVDYFDSLVNTAADYLRPYADNFVMRAIGNHETAVIKYQETDLASRLSRELGIEQMGYSGFIRFQFTKRTGTRSSKTAYFHHGSGGNSPVTKGVIGTARRAVYINADYLITGHSHNRWDLSTVQLNCRASGRVVEEEQVHIQIPSLKRDYDMMGGWAQEKGMAPQVVGAYWLRFYYDPRFENNIGYEFIFAR